ASRMPPRRCASASAASSAGRRWRRARTRNAGCDGRLHARIPVRPGKGHHMKTTVAIRNDHFEDLGTLKTPLRERGHAVHYVDATTDDLAAVDARAPDLLVVLGGPIGAYDEAIHPFLAAELDLVRRRLD